MHDDAGMRDRETIVDADRAATSAAPDALACRLPFTSERLAFLQPRLAQLLAELDLLDAVVDPSLEPAFTPRDTFGEDRHAR